MAQVIDALVVTLGFDTTGVKKGEDEAAASLKHVRDDAKATADDMESRGAQAASFFGQIQNKVLGLAAAYLGFGAVKAELTGVTLATADLGRAATVSGVAIGQLAAFGNLIARNGGDFAAATAQIQGLTQALERAKLLGQASPDFWNFLGTIGAGPGDDALKIMGRLADFAGRNRNNPQLVAQVASWGGITDNATISELLKGGTQYRADLERSRQLTVANEADAKAARELQSSFVGLKQAVDAYARDLVTKHGPAVDDFLKRATGWVQRGGLGYLGEGALTGFLASGFDPFGALVGAGVGAAMTPGGTTPGPSSDGSFGPRASLSFGGGSSQPSGSDLLPLFRSLERSGDSATSYKGAVGRYQILPSTAREYGFDPSRLKDPVYNTMVAKAILSDLYKRYNGNLDAVAVAYQSGPGAADKFLAAGSDPSVLGPQGRAYLAHEQLLGAGGQLSSLGARSTITSTTTIGTIIINTKATDATGITKSLRGVLAQNNVANQANSGLQ